MNLAKQYNNFADDFSKNHSVGENSNNSNREIFYSHIDFVKPGMKLLDLGCGDGIDLNHYEELGADVYGLDASEELIEIAKKRLPKGKLVVALFEDIPFEDNFFDVVLSKYAIMTSMDMEPVLKEVHRVLKPGGIMLYSVTHPLRAFFEKKEAKADYFEKKIADIRILGNTVTIQEPTHTMKDFLSDFLFKNFDIQAYDERWDEAAEIIEEMKYPGYFILKAKKR